MRHEDLIVESTQTQDGERRTVIQAKVLAELLPNSSLALFANLGRGQVFESGIVARHGSTRPTICEQGATRIENRNVVHGVSHGIEASGLSDRALLAGHTALHLP